MLIDICFVVLKNLKVKGKCHPMKAQKPSAVISVLLL